MSEMNKHGAKNIEIVPTCLYFRKFEWMEITKNNLNILYLIKINLIFLFSF